MSDKEVAALFSTFDVHRTGQLEVEEFVEIMQAPRGLLKRQSFKKDLTKKSKRIDQVSKVLDNGPVQSQDEKRKEMISYFSDVKF